MTTPLFVYGSLQRGFDHHPRLGASPFLGEARTTSAYCLFELDGYAVLAPGGRHSIRGELYAVDEGLLRELDAFEGDAYRRAPIELADGRSAQSYLAVPEALSGARLLHTDRWPRP